MNKQRKFVITTTYNELGIIIDTKVEEVAQPNLQPICNQLGTDAISRQQAINAFNTNIDELVVAGKENADVVERYLNRVIVEIKQLPPIQPEIVKCKDCKHYEYGICKKAGLCVNKSPNGFCDWGERREVTR